MPANTTVRLHYVFGYTPVARAWNRTVDDVIAAASALLDLSKFYEHNSHQ